MKSIFGGGEKKIEISFSSPRYIYIKPLNNTSHISYVRFVRIRYVLISSLAFLKKKREK